MQKKHGFAFLGQFNISCFLSLGNFSPHIIENKYIKIFGNTADNSLICFWLLEMSIFNPIEYIEKLKKLNGVIRVSTGYQHNFYGLCIQGENKQ